MRHWSLIFLFFLSSSVLVGQADSSGIKKVDAMVSRFYELSYENPDAALLLLDSADNLAKSLNYKLGVNEVARQRGQFYTERGDYLKSLGILISVLKSDEAIKNADGIGTDLLYIGLNFFQQHKMNEALNYMNMALKQYTDMKDEAGVALINANLGMIYRNANRFEEALLCYDSVRAFYIRDKNDNNLSRVENNIGNVLKDMGKYDQALEHFFVAKDLKLKTNEQRGLVIVLSNIADVYVEKYNFPAAFDSYELALTLAREQKSLNLQHDIYEDLSHAFEKKGDFKSAMECFKQAVKLNDSLNTEDYNHQMANMKVQFDTERKENENAVLKIDNQLQQERLAEEKKRKVVFASLFGLVLVVVILVFFLYRNKRKLSAELARTNEKINSQNTTLRTLNTELIESEENLTKANADKDQLLAMISHDLYNPVTSISNYTRQIREQSDELSKDQVKDAFYKISNGVVPLQDLLDNILQFARLEKRELVANNEKVQVSQVLKDVLGLYKPAAAFKKVILSGQGTNVPDLVTDRLMLYFVLRNVVNNAVKFAPSDSTVSVSSVVIQNTLEVVVLDKGIGFPSEVLTKLNASDEVISTHGSGIGLSVSRKFIAAMGGKIKFENSPNGGAKVTIRVPGKG